MPWLHLLAYHKLNVVQFLTSYACGKYTPNSHAMLITKYQYEQANETT